MTITDDLPELGEGIYTFPEARAILAHRDRRLTDRQLRHWLGSGLAPAAHRTDTGDAILTFHDLVSLEVVGRMTDVGMSVQRVRRIDEVRPREFPSIDRPFAYKLFYTDGADVWAQLEEADGTSGVVELVGKRSKRGVNHYVWADAIATFADAIRFGEDMQAVSWTLSPWVEIDPTVQFGTPLVKGTRVPVRTIVANLRSGTPAQVADWYSLSVDAVEGARDYAAVH